MSMIMGPAGNLCTPPPPPLHHAGYSSANSPPLSVSLATMRVLVDHYPVSETGFAHTLT